MRFSATAVASTRSNAVGAVEVECGTSGLTLNFLGVSAFRNDYAPAALTTGHELLVPWARLLQARAAGSQLYLELDPTLAPHNRLTLTSFQAVVPAAFKELRRQRWIVFTAVLSIALCFGVAAMVVGWRTGSVTPASALLVCLVGTAVILGLGLTTHRRLAFSPIDSEAARLIFLAELERYFAGFFRSATGPAAAHQRFQLPTFQGALPRTTLAIVITLTAASLAMVLSWRWLLTGRPSQAEDARLPANEAPLFGTPTSTRVTEDARGRTPEAPKVQPKPNPAEPDVRVGPSCRCLRRSSALWDQPIERMSILALSEKGKTKGRKSLLLVDVGIVNNGNEPLSEISLTVRFFDGQGKERHFTEDKVLYYAGPLGAGKAIKWKVEGEGSEFEVDNPIPGDIGTGSDEAAPADRFFELLAANHRPVRMHAAMMLAYLGDPRAKEAILKLRDALRDNEAPYLQRLVWAQSSVLVCDTTVHNANGQRTVSACVFNTADTGAKDMALRWRALQTPVSYKRPIAQPPLVLGEITVRLEAELQPKSGTVIEAPFALENVEPSTQFEVYADRVDLLP